MNDTTKTPAEIARRLSATQARMLFRIDAGVEPRGGGNWGNREAGRAASHWWRTYESLVRRGLVFRTEVHSDPQTTEEGKRVAQARAEMEAKDA